MLSSYLSLFNCRKSGHSPNNMVIRTWGYIPEITHIHLLKQQSFNLGESQKTGSPDTTVFLPVFHCEPCIYSVLCTHPVKVSHHHFPLIFKRDFLLLSAASIIVPILSAEIWWFISSAQTNFRLSILPCSSVKKCTCKIHSFVLRADSSSSCNFLMQQASGDKIGLNYSLTLNTSFSSKLSC